MRQTERERAEQAVRTALAEVRDPEVRRPVTELGMIDGVAISDDHSATVNLLLTITGCPAARHIEHEVRQATLAVPGITGATVNVGVMTPEQRAAFVEIVRGGAAQRTNQFGPESLTRVLAVTSGKGGVGKSSLTANLAVSFARSGLSVGLIDADVFGFSIPALMGLSRDGVTEQPTRVDDLILPPVAHGVATVSIGMFLGDQDPRTTAVSWRGPMLHRTIEQFLTDVWFGDLDILLLDLPPGTGDIAISVGQLLPQSEVVVVTTPQVAAADVAVRSALVARQTGQTVVGVVENMAAYTAPDGTVIDLFGAGGGEAVAQRLSDEQHGEVPLLGSVPLSPDFRAAGDAGAPAVLSRPDDPASAEIQRIAHRLLTREHSLRGKHLPIDPTAR